MELLFDNVLLVLLLVVVEELYRAVDGDGTGVVGFELV